MIASPPACPPTSAPSDSQALPDRHYFFVFFTSHFFQLRPRVVALSSAVPAAGSAPPSSSAIPDSPPPDNPNTAPRRYIVRHPALRGDYRSVSNR